MIKLWLSSISLCALMALSPVLVSAADLNATFDQDPMQKPKVLTREGYKPATRIYVATPMESVAPFPEPDVDDYVGALSNAIGIHNSLMLIDTQLSFVQTYADVYANKVLDEKRVEDFDQCNVDFFAPYVASPATLWESLKSDAAKKVDAYKLALSVEAAALAQDDDSVASAITAGVDVQEAIELARSEKQKNTANDTTNISRGTKIDSTLADATVSSYASKQGLQTKEQDKVDLNLAQIKSKTVDTDANDFLPEWDAGYATLNAFYPNQDKWAARKKTQLTRYKEVSAIQAGQHQEELLETQKRFYDEYVYNPVYENINKICAAQGIDLKYKTVDDLLSAKAHGEYKSQKSMISEVAAGSLLPEARDARDLRLALREGKYDVRQTALVEKAHKNYVGYVKRMGCKLTTRQSKAPAAVTGFVSYTAGEKVSSLPLWEDQKYLYDQNVWNPKYKQIGDHCKKQGIELIYKTPDKLPEFQKKGELFEKYKYDYAFYDEVETMHKLFTAAATMQGCALTPAMLKAPEVAPRPVPPVYDELLLKAGADGKFSEIYPQTPKNLTQQGTFIDGTLWDRYKNERFSKVAPNGELKQYFNIYKGSASPKKSIEEIDGNRISLYYELVGARTLSSEQWDTYLNDMENIKQVMQDMIERFNIETAGETDYTSEASLKKLRDDFQATERKYIAQAKEAMRNEKMPVDNLSALSAQQLQDDVNLAYLKALEYDADGLVAITQDSARSIEESVKQAKASAALQKEVGFATHNDRMEKMAEKNKTAVGNCVTQKGGELVDLKELTKVK